MMHRAIRYCMVGLSLCAATFAIAPRAAVADVPAAERTFLLTYAGRVTGLKPGESARVWLPVASSSADQQVEIVSQDLPQPPQINTEPRQGNRILYFRAAAGADGTVPFSITYKVTRHEVAEERSADDAADADDAVYLRPDALVPVGGKPSQVLLASRPLPDDQMLAGHLLYDLVDEHMQYRKDAPGWGRGDAVWACDSKFGNCTDFHSLFISLARTAQIPAKFEIGFLIPEHRGSGDVPGYHCWAKFKPQGRGWVPVDISEANRNPQKRAYFFGHLCENRVAFSSGRDLELVPRQSGGPVNFMIYPYVEVDDRPYPTERVQRSFHYQDLTTPSQPATAPAVKLRR
jgi:transglutaminase-like putative cysteine protease